MPNLYRCCTIAAAIYHLVGAVQAISWTLYHLLHHPECEAKVIEEVTAVLGPLGSPAAVTYDNIKQLVYTRACFLEALRLNPTAPSVSVDYACVWNALLCHLADALEAMLCFTQLYLMCSVDMAVKRSCARGQIYTVQRMHMTWGVLLLLL